MSSFRPDVEAVAVDFVPTALAPRGWSASARDAGPLASEAADAAEDAAASAAPTAEEIAALEQAAFQRGVESAQSDQQALDATCGALDRAVEALHLAAATSVTANRTLALELCRELVRHWVQDELTTSPEHYANHLDRALAELRDDAPVRLALASDDVVRLEEHAAEALARWRAAGIEITSDPALDAGSFTLETPSAGLDGRLDTIADRLRDALSPAIAAETPDSPGDAEAAE